MMRRPQKNEPLKLSANSQQLIALSTAVVSATSYLESQFWRKKLEESLLKCLKTGKQSVLDIAMEYLQPVDQEAHNVLLEVLESLTEATTISWKRKEYDVLLIAAPILAWTRFSIPSGELESDFCEAVKEQLKGSILAEDAEVLVTPYLYAIDQLPYSHTEIFSATTGFAEAITKKESYQLPEKQKTIPFLADIRYIVAAVMVPVGAPLFQWQMLANPAQITNSKKEILLSWQEGLDPLLGRVLPGCHFELLLPDAFFRACRTADQQIRPASIRAAVYYLMNALEVEPDDLCAVIGEFGEDETGKQIEEYRVGFALRTNSTILYGIVWPIYGLEEMQQAFLDANPDMDGLTEKIEKISQLTQITNLLQELNVPLAKKHTERFPLDFCDDCHTPLFVDENGELVHAEMPETAKQEVHFH